MSIKEIMKLVQSDHEEQFRNDIMFNVCIKALCGIEESKQTEFLIDVISEICKIHKIALSQIESLTTK